MYDIPQNARVRALELAVAGPFGAHEVMYRAREFALFIERGEIPSDHAQTLAAPVTKKPRGRVPVAAKARRK